MATGGSKKGLFPIRANANLRLSLKLLSWLGNWPPSGKLKKYYYFYTLTCFTLVVATYIFVQVAFMISVWGNYERMIDGSFLLMTNSGNCYKMIVVLARRRRIRALVEVAESRKFVHADRMRIHEVYAWQGILHHAAYQSLGGISICCWALASVIGILGQGEKRLPVESWYPYDVTKSPNFEMTCVQQILGEMILCCHNIALDTLVTNFVNVACCQLEILKFNLREIGDDDFFSHDVQARQLKSCVRHNTAIIHFKREIEKIFGTAIFWQCFINCVIICLTAFHMSQKKDFDLAEFVGTGLYLCGMTYQIFIYCWHGNELALHSEDVALAAYSGNWWKFDESNKRTLRILMIRCQRPLVLTVGKILTLSLDTFTSILRMSYSLFTVLQSSTET